MHVAPNPCCHSGCPSFVHPICYSFASGKLVSASKSPANSDDEGKSDEDDNVSRDKDQSDDNEASDSEELESEVEEDRRTMYAPDAWSLVSTTMRQASLRRCLMPNGSCQIGSREH